MIEPGYVLTGSTTSAGYLVKHLPHDFNHPRNGAGNLEVYLTENDPLPRVGEDVVVFDPDEGGPSPVRGRVVLLIAVVKENNA